MKVKVSIFSKAKGYDSPHAWPTGTFLQAGDSGIVFTKGTLNEAFADPDKGAQIVSAALGGPQPKSSYRTAFFEAFPNDPDTFIRGEGQTIAEADLNAYTQFLKFKACKEHNYEKRGYKNGAGFCKHCGMFKSEAFTPEPGY